MTKRGLPVSDRRIEHDRPLTIALTAELLEVSRMTVYNMLKDGRLKDTRISTLREYWKR